MATNFRVEFVCDEPTLRFLESHVSEMIIDLDIPIEVAINLCDIFKAISRATLVSITEDPEVPHGIARI